MIPRSAQPALLGDGNRSLTLVPLELPDGCFAAWFGGSRSDWIVYTRNRRASILAVAHIIGHLRLEHCGPFRDGGRLVCVGAHGIPDQVSHRLYRLFCKVDADGEADAYQPHPLFSAAQEHEADASALDVRRTRGGKADTADPPRPVGHRSFRCVG